MDRIELLKKNLPNFLKQSENLLQYVEAVGEFLNETEEYIESISYPTRYDRVGNVNLDRALSDFGFKLPASIPISLKRQLLRDAVQFILKTGTEDSITAILKMMGVNSSVEYGWMVSPDKIRRGYKTDIATGEDIRYDISKETSEYDLLYGEAYVDEDGNTFFSGYTYDDILKENLIEDIPIFGETYTGVMNHTFSVGKTPYLKVAIDGSDVNLVQSENINPDTGLPFTYTDDERSRMINDIITYFITKSNIPTHVKIIVLIVPTEDTIFKENLTVGDNFSDTLEYVHKPEYNFEETASVKDTFTLIGNATIPQIKIGDPVLIGRPSPFLTQFSLVDFPTIDDNEGGSVKQEIPSSPQTPTKTFHSPSKGLTHDILLWAKTKITFTAPSNANVTLIGLDAWGDSTGTTVTTVTAGNSYTFLNGGDYHALKVQYSFATEERVTFNVTYG